MNENMHVDGREETTSGLGGSFPSLVGGTFNQAHESIAKLDSKLVR